MNQAKPVFQDILDLVAELPDYPAFAADQAYPVAYMSDWLAVYSSKMDLSRGFLVNRCALYWTGYSNPDGFDGQAFVDSCQDDKGSLRQLAQILDTDLQIFELDPHSYGSRSADELALAASYGMMAIEEGTQLFCACSFGQGVDDAASNALDSLSVFNDAEDFMTRYCGLDHAAMLGSALAATLKGIPVILEGNSGKLVKCLIEKITGKIYNNIIVTDDMAFPLNHSVPGQKMIMSAIILKTVYAAQMKTDCGKVKTAA
tara:strand:- start:1828 stop:2604 length:777 start_codon:yes stop_codon:yes gene_type:complete